MGQERHILPITDFFAHIAIVEVISDQADAYGVRVPDSGFE